MDGSVLGSLGTDLVHLLKDLRGIWGRGRKLPLWYTRWLFVSKPSLQMKKSRLGTSYRSRFQLQVVCSQIQLLCPVPLVARYGDLES